MGVPAVLAAADRKKLSKVPNSRNSLLMSVWLTTVVAKLSSTLDILDNRLLICFQLRKDVIQLIGQVNLVANCP